MVEQLRENLWVDIKDFLLGYQLWESFPIHIGLPFVQEGVCVLVVVLWDQRVVERTTLVLHLIHWHLRLLCRTSDLLLFFWFTDQEFLGLLVWQTKIKFVLPSWLEFTNDLIFEIWLVFKFEWAETRFLIFYLLILVGLVKELSNFYHIRF